MHVTRTCQRKRSVTCVRLDLTASLTYVCTVVISLAANNKGLIMHELDPIVKYKFGNTTTYWR